MAISLPVKDPSIFQVVKEFRVTWMRWAAALRAFSHFLIRLHLFLGFLFRIWNLTQSSLEGM